MIRIFHSSAKQTNLQKMSKIREGCWVHVESPTTEELEKLTEDYKLDFGLLSDGIDPNESPRIERWGGITYVYTRYCLPESERLTTAPLLIIYAEEVTLTVSGRQFSDFDHFIKEHKPLTSKRAQFVLQLLTEINNGYKFRINNVSKRIWQIRAQLNKAHIDNKDFITFIDIEEDLNDFLLALEPMNSVLNSILAGKFIRLYEDDKDLIEDLELGSEELINLASSRLKTIQNVREAYNTLTANNLNKVFKLMTSITILMGIFTLITGIYSMNISLPAAHNPQAFWIILGITGGLIAWVAYLFKRKGWF
jgi:magnesium transporter